MDDDELDLSGLPRFLTVAEAAKVLRVHEETLRRGIRSGRVHAVVVGRGYRLTDDEIRRIAQVGLSEPRKGRKKVHPPASPVSLAGGREWPGREAPRDDELRGDAPASSSGERSARPFQQVRVIG